MVGEERGFVDIVILARHFYFVFDVRSLINGSIACVTLTQSVDGVIGGGFINLILGFLDIEFNGVGCFVFIYAFILISPMGLVTSSSFSFLYWSKQSPVSVESSSSLKGASRSWVE